MAKNSIALKGNLARDPFFDYLSGRNSPVPFMRFVLAVDRHPPRREGTDYLQVVAYGQRALHDHAFLRQGSEILVEGWLRTREGTDDRGESMLRTEVVAEEITFLRNIEWERGNEAWNMVQEQLEREQCIPPSHDRLPVAAG
jgi:single-stranded DNA-binding protein